MMNLNNSSMMQRPNASDLKHSRTNVSTLPIIIKTQEPTSASINHTVGGIKSSDSPNLVSLRTARVTLLKSTLRMTKTNKTSSWQPRLLIERTFSGRLNTLIKTHSTRSSVWLKTDHSHSSVPLTQPLLSSEEETILYLPTINSSITSCSFSTVRHNASSQNRLWTFASMVQPTKAQDPS